MANSTIRDGLPFNIEDLIHRRAIESNRVEFKATWDDLIKAAVIRTICAFANDLLNLNGGYIVLGLEEHQGMPILPPRGLGGINLERVQNEIRGSCNRMKPVYQPVLFPTFFQEEPIMIIWAPGGDNRPYQAPDNVNQKGTGLSYYVRQGPSSVGATGEVLRQLMESAAKIPFDDRRNQTARIEDISPTLVRRYLHDIRSDLVANGFSPADDLYLYR
jgi:ATP-dependent DNA helicase RecG